jgi:integrase/recombinase XerD
MSIKISTLLAKVQSLPNEQNRLTIMDFYNYMQEEGSSENHQINNLKVIIDFSKHLGQKSFHDIKKKEQVLFYLNGKVKDPQTDPDKRWITTWNHYLNRIKLFFRWLYNFHLKC